MNRTLNEIAGIVNGTVDGDGTIFITGLNGLREAQKGELSFLSDPGRYKIHMDTTGASAVLVPSTYAGNGRSLVRVENPYEAFAALLRLVERERRRHPKGIHPAAIIGENVELGENVALDAHVRIADNCQIGEDVILYAGVYVGFGSVIGDGTVVYPNSTIREDVQIGKRCIIHSNVAIGSDGFGFTPMNGKHEKIPQIGGVRIGDDVEIGSNTSIDRATCGLTTIGSGTKIDNQVQIAHNVAVGENTTISGNCAIAGSAKIGNNVTIGGQSGVGGHIEIGDHAMVGGKTGVTKSLPAGAIVSGHYAMDHEANRRAMAALKDLPRTVRRLRRLERRVEDGNSKDG